MNLKIKNNNKFKKILIIKLQKKLINNMILRIKNKNKY